MGQCVQQRHEYYGSNQYFMHGERVPRPALQLQYSCPELYFWPTMVWKLMSLMTEFSIIILMSEYSAQQSSKSPSPSPEISTALKLHQ